MGTHLIIDEKSELEFSVVVKQTAVGAHCGDDDHALLFALERLNGAHFDPARSEMLAFQPFLDFVHLFKTESLIYLRVVSYVAGCAVICELCFLSAT